MKNIDFKHTPVLLNECIEALNISPDGIFVDGTFGGGGHSFHILNKLEKGKLIAIDKDEDALQNGKNNFKSYDKIIFVKNDFKEISKILDDLNIEKVDGILLDLGVSSYQIDTPARGFSYRFDGELDMRMDKENPLTAYDVVNTYSYEKLRDLLFTYGEESNAKKIAMAIVKQREIAPISTTMQLVETIEKVIPKRFGAKNPSTKTFQAIRIEVNGELEGLAQCVDQMINRLNKGGRLAIITFHSLEDRIIKQTFKKRESGCICDKNIPVCICNHKPEIILINKKPIVATSEEQKKNKRSTSAKLRVIEKL